jgi:hypothetical protein
MKYGKALWILFIVAFSLPVQGQTIFKVNQYNIIYNGDYMPVFTLYSNYSFNSKVGFATYFYVNGYKKNSWGEGLAGPNWSPLKGVSLAFLAGFQSNEKSLWRISPIFNISKHKFSAFGGFEYGGKRHRWDVMSFYILNKFKIGGELIRFYKMYAAGPRVEYSFLKMQPLTIFYSGLWDWQNKKYASMFGIYTTFGASK